MSENPYNRLDLLFELLMAECAEPVQDFCRGELEEARAASRGIRNMLDSITQDPKAFEKFVAHFEKREGL